MGAIATIDDELAHWLAAQPVFFVATAPRGEAGHVNCSPKGNRNEFTVLDPMTVAYLDQTGSGIETIAHLRENGRITIMFCAFSGPPRIVRLQGRATFAERGTDDYAHALASFPEAARDGARAVIVARLDRVADSCGYGVPLMTFTGHRAALDAWASKQGPERLAAYRSEHNARSIDRLPGLDPGADGSPAGSPAGPS